VRLPELLECRAIDSGVAHSVSGIECETARAAAFMGYKMICDWEDLPVTAENSGRIPRWSDPRWNGYLSNLAPSEFRARYENRLPVQSLGADYLREFQTHVDPFTPLRAEVNYLIRGATRYAVEENHRIHTFIELARGASGAAQPEAAFELMGELMYQSHHSYTECGLASKATDYLVSLVRDEGRGAGLYGAKITGGGAGGTVAVLGRADADAAFERVVARYAEFSGTKPYVFEGSSDGADRFGVQTI
jgi:galactokinase